MYCRHCGEPMNDNQAICLKCGVEAGKGDSFCPNCGNPVAAEAVICVNCGISLERKKKNSPNLIGIQKRDLVKAIVLSIVTCGIYGIIWFVGLTNDMNRASGRVNDASGVTAFLLTIVTCGIYSIYWAYQLGEKRDIVAGDNNGSSSVLYLILALFGFGIVAYALAQDTLNKALDDNN